MLLPAFVVFFIGLVVALYLYLRARPSARSLWRSAVSIGTFVGLSRALLACVGWFVVEHSSSFLQIPAFWLTMLALPEGVVFSKARGRHLDPMPVDALFLLGILLFASTLLLVSAAALLVQVTKFRRVS